MHVKNTPWSVVVPKFSEQIFTCRYNLVASSHVKRWKPAIYSKRKTIDDSDVGFQESLISSKTTLPDFHNAMLIYVGSLYVFGKLPTYPFPKPTFCPKWEASGNVGLGDG